MLGECLLAMETECVQGESACECEVAVPATGAGYCLQQCEIGGSGCPRETDQCYRYPDSDIPYCRRNCTDLPRSPTIGDTVSDPNLCHPAYTCVDMATASDQQPDSPARYICFLD